MRKHLIITLSIVGIFYLCGAFGNASFNIKEWSEAGREFVSIFMGMFLLAGNAFIATKNIMKK